MIDLKKNWTDIKIVSSPMICDDQSVVLEDLYQAFKERLMLELGIGKDTP